jgi:hypothetical protein
MTIPHFLILAGIVVCMLFLYRFADRRIKALPAKTVKAVNWAGFALAMAGGIVWYALKYTPSMYVMLAGVVLYFLFYGYDRNKTDTKAVG